MKKENKEVFDEMKEVDEKQGVDVEDTEKVQPTTDDDMVEVEDDFEDDFDEEEQDLSISVQSKSKEDIKKERGERKPMNGKTLTIESATIMPPRIYTTNNKGERVRLPPNKTKNGNEYYSTKLKVRFKEENIVEYYPSIKIWVNDGKIKTDNVQMDSSRFNSKFLSSTKVAQIIRLALHKMNGGKDFELEEITMNEKPVISYTSDTADDFFKYSEKVSDAEILEWMVGQKVKIDTSKGNYDGRNWFRNDIKEFV